MDSPFHYAPSHAHRRIHAARASVLDREQVRATLAKTKGRAGQVLGEAPPGEIDSILRRFLPGGLIVLRKRIVFRPWDEFLQLLDQGEKDPNVLCGLKA
jgi:hypothetical protein